MANYLIKNILHTTFPLAGEKYRFGSRLYERCVGSIAECDATNDPRNLTYGQTMRFRKFRDGDLPEEITLKTAISAEYTDNNCIKIRFSGDFEVIFEPATAHTRTYHVEDPLTALGLRK